MEKQKRHGDIVEYENDCGCTARVVFAWVGYSLEEKHLEYRPIRISYQRSLWCGRDHQEILDTLTEKSDI